MKSNLRRSLEPNEHQIQAAAVQWAQLNEQLCPLLKLLYAIPNGGARHPAVAMKMKREGVKPGVPDLCLPVRAAGFSGLYIETKTRTGVVKRHQREFMDALAGQGYVVVLCRSTEEIINTLRGYLQALGYFSLDRPGTGTKKKPQAR